MTQIPSALTGLRVIDASTVIAGPNCARYLADYGADVIKVERPDTGDSLRNMAWRDPRDGTGLWWKLANRNKRTIDLDLKEPGDRDLFLQLVDEADVLIENFRPGTLERLGLSPAVLHERNPGLVITRVTGFGQDGPYAHRPGFASIAESMAGFAAVNGEPDGPPLLPAIALTDELTAIVAAFATMMAIHARDSGNAAGGQVVDVSLLESIFQIMGPTIGLYRLTGELQPRLGSGLSYTVPRGAYLCGDGRWVGISASSDTVAMRVLAILGLDHDDRFRSFDGRTAHREELDDAMRAWCITRARDEVLRVFEDAEAAAGPIMDMADISADPHYAARDAIVTVGETPMQGLVAKLSATPGQLRWEGRPRNADGEDIRHHGW
jgi:crotonobetainyl-CoA:carnitine CoA-transferase CaiB-like acyl-CoA transferase